MKNAFTMVELIFVIVILGVLAAVAIPRLSATRDDAENVSLAQNIVIGAGEIASYAVARGQIENNLSVMSRGIDAMVRDGKATLDVPNRKVSVIRGAIADCVIVQVEASGNDDNLTISLGNSSSDTKCAELQALIDMNIYPLVLRGTKIVQ